MVSLTSPQTRAELMLRNGIKSRINDELLYSKTDLVKQYRRETWKSRRRVRHSNVYKNDHPTVEICFGFLFQ